MPSHFYTDDAAQLPGTGDVLSVSALNRLARTTLEQSIPLLRVSGEVSNLTRAPSGHLYFTLKDDQAQVRCTMWRNRAQTLPFRPENGMEVEARALVTLYEPRGDFQLNVEGLRQGGTGSLFEAFVRLKEKLGAEGLFDPASKKALPQYPHRIGVVTSPAAAAFQDVLAALRRRAPHIDVVLYPSPVQGDAAARCLAESVRVASSRADRDGIDVLLLVRGGGSLEDLWSFNNEALARAIKACGVPVICGVGHETDFTIADFAADARAATPTVAAELASAGYHEAAARLSSFSRMLTGSLQSRIDTLAQRLDRAAVRLLHPRERIRQSDEAVQRLQVQLESALVRRVEREASRTGMLALRLRAARPDFRAETGRCERLSDRLAELGKRLIVQRRERLDALAAHLEHLAPEAVLARGFSITRNFRGEILHDASDAATGESISIELAKGRIEANVTGTRG